MLHFSETDFTHVCYFLSSPVPVTRHTLDFLLEKKYIEPVVKKRHYKINHQIIAFVKESKLYNIILWKIRYHIPTNFVEKNFTR